MLVPLSIRTCACNKLFILIGLIDTFSYIILYESFITSNLAEFPLVAKDRQRYLIATLLVPSISLVA